MQFLDVLNALTPFVGLASLVVALYLVRWLRLITKGFEALLHVMGIDKDLPNFVNTAGDFAGRFVAGRAGGEAVSAVISDTVINEGTKTFPAFIKFVLTLLGGHFHGNDVAFMEWLVTNVPQDNLSQSVFLNMDKAQLEDLQNMRVILSDAQRRIDEKETELKQKLEPPKPQPKPQPKKKKPL